MHCDIHLVSKNLHILQVVSRAAEVQCYLSTAVLFFNFIDLHFLRILTRER